jgi:hypothetical protein
MAIVIVVIVIVVVVTVIVVKAGDSLNMTLSLVHCRSGALDGNQHNPEPVVVLLDLILTRHALHMAL